MGLKYKNYSLNLIFGLAAIIDKKDLIIDSKKIKKINLTFSLYLL
jgi:hypothetical protein